MKQATSLVSVVVSGLLMFVFSEAVGATPDAGASKIRFQITCDAGDNNCFAASEYESMLDWIWNVRQPSEYDTLEVDIGAGGFGLPTNTLCDGSTAPTGSGNTGYVSFKGAGRGITILSYDTLPPHSSGYPVIKLNDCTNLSFQDLTIHGFDTAVGVQWNGGGTSVWSNVDVMQGYPYSWVDNGGLHYWFGSRIEGANVGQGYKFAYRSNGGETWFYGGDIVGQSTEPKGAIGMYVLGGSAHIFGASVRAIVNSSADSLVDVCSALGIAGLVAEAGGIIHMHGGVVAVTSKGTGNISLCGAHANTGGYIHTPDTAFRLAPSGTGVATRIKQASGGIVDAPFQWPGGEDVPVVVSENGQDTFVEQDCDSSGNCESAAQQDQRPHMMVYTDACMTYGAPWFDVATNKCRGE